MDTIASLTNTLLLHLTWASIQATLLIGLLWLLGRASPRLPAPTRCLLWWLLGAQLCVGLAWQAPVTLPLLPPAQVTTTATQAPKMIHVDTQNTSATAAITTTPAAATHVSHALSWREALAALWLSGLLAQLALVTRQWLRTRRIRRQSKPLHDPRLQALCAGQAERLGLRHCPDLRVSDAIGSPQVTGLWRPAVLLPARTALTSSEQTMALAHELAHVRRGDLWLGWIPALAKGLFFFHPLVRLAVREYTLHREAACDGLALRLQASAPRAYGQLLLHLGIERPMPAGLTGVASASFKQLKRRLAMLQESARAMPRARDWVLVALVALACVMPYRIVAANGDAQGTRQAAENNGFTSDLSPPPSPAAAGAQNASSKPEVMAATADHCLPAADNIGFCGAHFLWYARPPKTEQGVVFFDRHHVIIHGTHADVVAAKLFYEPDASALWFRRGDKTWVTHNKETIERARRIYARALKRIQQSDQLATEDRALADKQSAIASQRAAFAQKQAALARQRSVLARKRASLAQKQTSLTQQEIALQRGSAGATAKTTAKQIDAERNAIATERRALDAQRQALNTQRARLAQQRAGLEAKLNAQRQALNAQRADLATRRHALATHRKQAAEQSRQAVRKLLDEVLAKDLAEPAKQD